MKPLPVIAQTKLLAAAKPQFFSLFIACPERRPNPSPTARNFVPKENQLRVSGILSLAS